MNSEEIKIWYQNPVPLLEPYKGLESMLQQTTAVMGRAGTTIDLQWLKHGYADPTFIFTMRYNALSEATAISGAEKQGYDAAVIGNALDFGLQEARSVAKIPVVGVTEAALYVASSLGYFYSIIVVHHQIGQFADSLLKQYGMSSRLAGIADMGVSLAEVAATYENTDRLLDLFQARAARTIKEDGAEVIIVCCTMLSSLLTLRKIHSIDGVPIVDPVWAGIKMAELMVDVQRLYGIEACRRSHFNTYPHWRKEMPNGFGSVKE